MILGVYVMRDSRTSYMMPTFDQTDMAAMRNFEAACMRPDSLLHTHPQDFALYRIGDYDNETGRIRPMDPVLICDSAQFVSKEVTR